MRKAEGIKCPLCGEFIKYKPYHNSHFWICPECPFVGLEYRGYEDMNNLQMALAT